MNASAIQWEANAANAEYLCRKRDMFLHEIEGFLGPRDKRFELGSCQMTKESQPCIFHNYATGNVDVHLTGNAFSSPSSRVAEWQLAHECVHLIDPYVGGTNVLEEGLAVWFQLKKDATILPGMYRYKYAFWFVLNYLHCGLLHAVKSIRSGDSVKIGDISSEALMREVPGMSQGDANILSGKFGNVR